MSVPSGGGVGRPGRTRSGTRRPSTTTSKSTAPSGRRDGSSRPVAEPGEHGPPSRRRAGAPRRRSGRCGSRRHPARPGTRRAARPAGRLRRGARRRQATPPRSAPRSMARRAGFGRRSLRGHAPPLRLPVQFRAVLLAVAAGDLRVHGSLRRHVGGRAIPWGLRWAPGRPHWPPARPPGQVQQRVAEQQHLDGHRAVRAPLRVIQPVFEPPVQALDLGPELARLFRRSGRGCTPTRSQAAVPPLAGPRMTPRERGARPLQDPCPTRTGRAPRPRPRRRDPPARW